MNTKYESMNGITKLYELRREETMRKGREWFSAFSPNSLQDIVDTLSGEDESKFRMVASYWEMAASFVNHGVIDEQMFSDANAEHISVFAKIEPYIEEMRAMSKLPQLFINLEKLVMRVPNAKERMIDIRQRAKTAADSSSAKASGAATQS